MAPGALGPAAVAVSLASRLPRGGGGGSSLSAAAWWGFSGGRLSVLGGERLVCVLSAITCLAGMTRRRGGGGYLLWSQGSYTVLPQWLQVKWQRRESPCETGTGRHPVDAKTFSVQL